MASRWTKAELEYLENHWGCGNIAKVAKKLGRSIEAVKRRGWVLGLEGWTQATDLITANALAEGLGISNSGVYMWIRRDGLPCRSKIVKGKTLHHVDIEEFWEWAKDHQHLFDSRRMEPLILGPEPRWMVDKRKRDHQNRREECITITGLRKITGKNWSKAKALIEKHKLSTFVFGGSKATFVSKQDVEKIMRGW